MKCIICGGEKYIREHAVGAVATVSIVACDTCLTTSSPIPQPSKDEVLRQREALERHLRNRGMEMPG